MARKQHQIDLDTLVRRASKILNVPCRPFVLDGILEHFLFKEGVRQWRRGLVSGGPLIGFHAHGRGHRVVAAMECYRLEIDGGPVQVVRILNMLPGAIRSPSQDFCVVPEEHYVRLYRFLRTKARRQPKPEEPCPVMDEDDRQRLFDNTVGFLLHGSKRLKAYGVAQKRGVLLTGEPGNGKTMACRWLFSQCCKHNLEWRLVRAEEYEHSRNQGMAQYMFRLDSPGIVLFDDFDLAVRNRDEVGPTSHHSTFLGEMDGVEPNDGVVYLFTSNAQFSQLDPAFLRPGRIDQVFCFPRPDEQYRRRLVQRWNADIVAGIDLERAICQTEGLSYAEIEEVKKLLVLHYLETDRWDWERAWDAFQQDDRREKPRRRLGFDVGRGDPLEGAHGVNPMLNELGF